MTDFLGGTHGLPAVVVINSYSTPVLHRVATSYFGGLGEALCRRRNS